MKLKNVNQDTIQVNFSGEFKVIQSGEIFELTDENEIYKCKAEKGCIEITEQETEPIITVTEEAFDEEKTEEIIPDETELLEFPKEEIGESREKAKEIKSKRKKKK